MSAPRVSVVLPCHNGAHHLDEAVASIRSQSFKDWELVLVDDGSTDETPALAEAWAARDPRIRALRLESNRGLPAALNAGFREARGELFSWTSDDNVLLPNALERMAARLDDDPFVDLVYADYIAFDEDGQERRVHVGRPETLPLKNLFGCCFLYRREVHEELCGFDEDLFLAEDHDFWLRASARFQCEAIPEVLYRYRQHPGSLSATRMREATLAAVRAVERSLPNLSHGERAQVQLRWAWRLLACGETRRARGLVAQALRTSPLTALRPQHVRTLTTAALGARIANRLWSLRRGETPAAQLLLLDLMGGVTSYNMNLAAARPTDGLDLALHWFVDENDPATRAPNTAALPDVRVSRSFHRWPQENLFSVLRRIHRRVGRRPGVLVANEFLGLAYAARFGGRAPSSRSCTATCRCTTTWPSASRPTSTRSSS